MTDFIHGGLLLLGLSLLIAAVWQYKITNNLLRTGQKVVATVVEHVLVESKDDDGTRLLYQTVMVFDVKGKQHFFHPIADLIHQLMLFISAYLLFMPKMM